MTITDTTPVQDVVLAVVVPDDILANARELSDVRAALKVLNDREDSLKKKVRGYLEGIGEDAAAQDGVAISLVRASRTGVNSKRLEALYPNVYTDVLTSTPYVQVRAEVKG